MLSLCVTTTDLDLKRRETFSDVLPGLIGLMRRRHPLWKEAPEEELADWLRWYWDHGFLGKSMDEAGNCHALVTVRLLGAWQDFVDEWAYDPAGEICFVELALGESRSALREAVEQLRLGHHQPALLMWERRSKWDREKKPNQGSLRIYTWRMFTRMMENLYEWRQ